MHVNPLEMTSKVASVIGMTFLYDAGYSIVLLRRKNEVKPLTQSAEKWICMGKWPLSNLAEFIHQVLVIPCVPEFFSPVRTVPWFLEKKTPVQNDQRAGAKRFTN